MDDEVVAATRGHLRLSGPAILQAIAAMVGAQRRGNKVYVSFDNDQLVIARGSTTVSVPATGRWPDHAVIGPRLLKTLVKLKDRLHPSPRSHVENSVSISQTHADPAR